MSRFEQHRYELFLRVLHFGRVYRALFSSCPVAGQLFDAIAAAALEMEQAEAVRVRDRSGCRCALKVAQAALRSRLMAITQTAHVLARLTPQVTCPLSNARNQGRRGLLRASRLCLHWATPLTHRFVEFGMPVTFLRDLRVLADQLDSSEREHRASIVRARQARATIAAARARGFQDVRVLHALAVNILHDQPELLAVWKRNRRAGLRKPFAENPYAAYFDVVTLQTATSAPPPASEWRGEVTKDVDAA